MNRVNKILSTKYSYTVVVPYLLFFLFLSAEKELLHNHKYNESERDNCPALVISKTISSGITINFELQNEFIVEFNIDIPQLFPALQQKPSASYLRGPPLV